jgi:hypothetical protein
MPTLAARFRALHRADAPLRLLNAWDVGSAKVMAAAGAPAIATTSAGIAKALGLPDGAALTRGYRERAQALDAWRQGASTLSLDAAARESFLLGDEAIHALIFDPWLPEPLVDTEARQAFVRSVMQFDAAGRVIWQELLRAARESAPRRHALIQPPLESPP